MNYDRFGRDGASIEDLLPTYYIILPKLPKKASLYNPELNREMYRSVQQVEYVRKN